MSLWQSIIRNVSSPRKEVVHNILNRWNHRDCKGSDLDEENCGAAIRVGRFKLLAGYPGDSRWSRIDNKAVEPWNWTAHGKNVWRRTRSDGCNLESGVGCPCWHGYCLFDLASDPAERFDISEQLPAVVARLKMRLAAAAETATQGAHLCWPADALDKKALAKRLEQSRAHLPYAQEESSPWQNDLTAYSCYNPCPFPAKNHTAPSARLPSNCRRAATLAPHSRLAIL